MARLIESGLFEDDFVGGLDFFQRLVWIGIWSAVADDQGRFMDNPALIRAKVFLYDEEVTDDMVEKALRKMAKAGRIIRYGTSGRRLCQIANWWMVQKPSWASESKYVAPGDWVDRVKMHAIGGAIKIGSGWNTPGGYPLWEYDLPAELPGAKPSALPSVLPSGLPSGIKEVKGEVKGEVEPEAEAEAEKGQPAAAAGGKGRDPLMNFYSDNIGSLTPMIAAELADLEREYTSGWVVAALEEAVRHEARNLKYAQAVLKRWKTDGLGSRNGKPKALMELDFDAILGVTRDG